MGIYNNPGPSNIVLPFHKCEPPPFLGLSPKIWSELNKFYINFRPNFFIKKICESTRSKNFSLIIKYSGRKWHRGKDRFRYSNVILFYLGVTTKFIFNFQLDNMFQAAGIKINV